MKIKLFCRDDEKCPAEIKPFMIEIDEEAVQDINNIATVFCPHCNRKMKSPEQSYNDDPPPYNDDPPRQAKI